jgi:hypothetical protein
LVGLCGWDPDENDLHAEPLCRGNAFAQILVTIEQNRCRHRALVGECDEVVDDQRVRPLLLKHVALEPFAHY